MAWIVSLLLLVVVMGWLDARLFQGVRKNEPTEALERGHTGA